KAKTDTFPFGSVPVHSLMTVISKERQATAYFGFLPLAFFRTASQVSYSFRLPFSSLPSVV
ncbi:MAG: hypothetical protein O7F74_09945, partial [Bacteroidetes bacterium]|nr:hypothetical protein [Bacteroidota bacterium]